MLRSSGRRSLCRLATSCISPTSTLGSSIHAATLVTACGMALRDAHAARVISANLCFCRKCGSGSQAALARRQLPHHHINGHVTDRTTVGSTMARCRDHEGSIRPREAVHCHVLRWMAARRVVFHLPAMQRQPVACILYVAHVQLLVCLPAFGVMTEVATFGPTG